MFNQLIESTTSKRRTRKWTFLTVTAGVWMLILSAAIIAGILTFDAHLSDQLEKAVLVIPLPPPHLPGRGPTSTGKRGNPPPVTLVSPATPPIGITAPRNTPPAIVGIGPSDAITGTGGSSSDGALTGVPDGNFRGVPYGASSGNLPPPPVPDPPRVRERQAEAPARKIIPQSSGVLQGTAVRRVEPIYPPLALAAKVSDRVVVEVIIDEQGHVISARAISGHLLLREASVRAAREWRWKPTLLNGLAVKVTGTITFNFKH